MNVVLIISGSISAFKALELIRMFVKKSYNVKVCISSGGLDFVTKMSVEALSQNQCLTHDSYKMEHIELAKWMDFLVVYPASASFIGKMSNGLGSDVALDLILAAGNKKPRFFAPAMNPEMYQNAIVFDNIEKLKSVGFVELKPDLGKTLCGDYGYGKLLDPLVAFDLILSTLEGGAGSELSLLEKDLRRAGQWAHKKQGGNDISFEGNGEVVMVSIGGTSEAIDGVRCITNFSSGLQGVLIVKSLLDFGFSVVVLKAGIDYEAAKLLEDLSQNFDCDNVCNKEARLKIFTTKTAQEMLKVALENILNPEKDKTLYGFISCAAVSDFYIANKVDTKIKKQDGFPELKFEKNPDILKSIGTMDKKNRPRFVVGFAAELENLLEYGFQKMKSKNCDIMIANSPFFGKKETKGFFLMQKYINHNSINDVKLIDDIPNISDVNIFNFSTTKQKLAETLCLILKDNKS